MRLPFEYDWRKPDLTAVFDWRAETLAKLRAKPSLLPDLRAYYRANQAQFITDWGMTFDPRNAEREMPSAIPFVLWPRQAELVESIVAHWRSGTPLLIEKSRDTGVSWITMALACTLCLFTPELVIGFGSRKAEYVDQSDSPKSLFWKARAFLNALPREWRGSWNVVQHSKHMRIVFPESGSYLTGECGDGIGRGDRTSLYFVDEAAFLEHPDIAEGSLSSTTRCRIDLSTPNGLGNPFAQKRHSGRIDVFTMSWRHDPRKDEAWFAEQCERYDDLTIARELELNYADSLEGQFIPSKWVEAAIDAHIKLGITPTGTRRAAFDVADEGMDLNACGGRHGILVEHLKSWRGKGSDIYRSVEKVFALCEEWGYDGFDYDSDGLGSGVRGDARTINEARIKEGKDKIRDEPFRGSAAVFQPEGEMVRKRKNKDFFANLKAQSWWWLRLRFQNTYRAVVEKLDVDPESIISLSSTIPELLQIRMELPQPTYSLNNVGKVVIDKQPNGARSPNHADVIMMLFNPSIQAMETWTRLGRKAG